MTFCSGSPAVESGLSRRAQMAIIGGAFCTTNWVVWVLCAGVLFFLSERRCAQQIVFCKLGIAEDARMSLGTDVNPPPVTRIESETCLQRRGQPYPPEMGLFGTYLVYQQLLVRLSRLSPSCRRHKSSATCRPPPRPQSRRLLNVTPRSVRVSRAWPSSRPRASFVCRSTKPLNIAARKTCSPLPSVKYA